MNRQILILAVAVSLTGCSGASFAVVPCSIGGQLAFKLGKLKKWFGLSRVGPEVSSVQVFVPMQEPNWALYPDIDESPDNRTLIEYGGRLPGTIETISPKPLINGARYRVLVKAGPHDGMVDFVHGAPLPQCSAVLLD